MVQKFLLFCLVFVLLLSFRLSAQKFALSGGINLNNYYHLEGNRPNYFFNANAKAGYSFGIDFWELNRIHVSARYNSYNTFIEEENYSIGGGWGMQADQYKKSFLFSIYYTKQIDKVNMGLGLYASRVLKCSFDGYQKIWGNYVPNGVIRNSLSRDIDNNISNWGFSAYAGREMYLTDQLFLIPRFTVYIGLTNELTGIRHEAKPCTFSIHGEIGIGWKFSKESFGY